MPHIKRSKVPTQPRGSRAQSRTASIKPGGVNTLVPSWELQGASPHIENFERDPVSRAARVRPRLHRTHGTSSVTQIGRTVLSIPTDQAVSGVRQQPYLFMLSGDTGGFTFLAPVPDPFLMISYSSSTTGYASATSVGHREPISYTVVDTDILGEGTPTALFAGPFGTPGLVAIDPFPAPNNNPVLLWSIASFMSDSSVSDHAPISSIVSHTQFVNYVASIDQRVVYLGDTGIFWSVRGNPLEFDVATGAGFDTLNDIGNTTTGMVAEQDRLLLFSDQQTWEGRPRRDIFAFDFRPLDKHVGVPPNRSETIAPTPVGTIFQGYDEGFYLVSGDRVVRLGSVAPAYLRDIKNGISETGSNETPFATYDDENRIYKYFFNGGRRALWLYVDDLARGNETWYPQRFGVGSQPLISAAGAYGVYNSTGTTYSGVRMDSRVSGATIGDEPQLDATWTLPALSGSDPSTYESPRTLWLDYTADSDVSLSILRADEDGGNLLASSSYDSIGEYRVPGSRRPATEHMPFEPAARQHPVLALRARISSQNSVELVVHGARVDFADMSNKF